MISFKRVEVGYVNTPLEYLSNLTNYFNKGKIYIKRDDLTGLALGGNKTRKLDYIVKYALDNNYTTLLTYGAPQTNHGRLTIAAAAKFGLKSILICEGKKPEKMEGNLLLDRMLNGRIVFIDRKDMDEKTYQEYKIKVVQEVIKKYEANNEKVLEVAMGGSSPLGAYGYMQCIKEIVEQIAQQDIKIDHLVCAYGSMGTFAGLWLGAKYYQAPFDIIGIPVFPTPFALADCVKLINELAKECQIDIKCDISDLKVLGGLKNNKYAGPAYGRSNQEIRKAMYLLASQEAIITDPCYTGKVAYGLVDLIENDYFKNDNVLFLHTGGSPALYATPHNEEIQADLWNDNVEEY
ncbi:D-cysteine desulfhydrase family protein [Erysipelotrichaceae bacterium OttesenSCG-928-M19]|nr:D-cysteine desulfhydrase family protein [Erysipelotrichaceae bacterium OttesenSCG-928-M19]